ESAQAEYAGQRSKHLHARSPDRQWFALAGRRRSIRRALCTGVYDWVGVIRGWVKSLAHSVGLDIAGLDHFRPLDQLGTHEAFELLRRRGDDFHSDALQPRLDFRLVQPPRHVLLDFVDDRSRRPGTHDQSEKAGHVETWNSVRDQRVLLDVRRLGVAGERDDLEFALFR